MFENLHSLCTRETRLIVGYFSHLWYPLLKLAEVLRLKMPQPPQNVLAPADVRSLAALADFEAVKSERRAIVAAAACSDWAGSSIALLRRCRSSTSLCLRHYTVCRSLRHLERRAPHGNSRHSGTQRARQHRTGVRQRIPRFADALEIIFVEGAFPATTPGARSSASRSQPAARHQGITSARQGQGRRGLCRFRHRHGDVLMILDADLTVPPEQLPKFWQAIQSRQGRVRQRHAAGLSDGRRGHAVSQPRSPTRSFSQAFHLAARAAVHRYAVRHQGAAPKRLPASRRPGAAISAISIRSAISI